MADKKGKKDQKDLLKKVRDRSKKLYEADEKNRRKALEDMKFVHVPGSQWDPVIRRERGERPCYEFNKLRVTIKRVVNDMRQNRPQAKIRGTEEGDVDNAEINEGLFRNIWNVSDADTVIDAAGEYQVGAGMGAWRVNTKYSGDTAFDLDIAIEPIRNPFNLFADPSCQDDLKRDARDWVLFTKMPKSVYEAKWPNADVVDFESDMEFDDDEEWEDDESVRVCEYWYKVPVQKVICLYADGSTVDKSDEKSVLAASEKMLQDGVTPNFPVRERAVQTHQIKMCIASGKAILEEADWPGDSFPFVIVYGESMIIDGEHQWWGLPRFAKDAQMFVNYSFTNVAESAALVPQAKFWATPKQAEGHTDKWAEAHKKLYPYMLANPDPAQPGFPQPMSAPQMNQAMLALMEVSAQGIRDTTGIFESSLGQEENANSGRAIIARQQQGEIAVFNYMDNMAKGIKRTAEIVLGLIPKVYDTQRQLRILGKDGAEKYVRINQPGPNGEVINDMGRGKYDVTVTVGPSYATRRMEAVAAYTEMFGQNPQVFPMVADLVVKEMDLPQSDKMSERLRALLPPGIAQEDGEQQMPPQAIAAMQQADAMAQAVQQQMAVVQEEGAKVQQDKAAVDKAISQLQVQQAQFKALIAEKQADLVLREAQFTQQQAQAGSDESGKAVQADREALSTQVQSAIAEIRQMAAQFMQQSIAVLAEIQAKQQPVVIPTKQPMKKMAKAQKVGGQWVIESLEVPVDG